MRSVKGLEATTRFLLRHLRGSARSSCPRPLLLLSLIEFFSKMKKWQDMADLPPDFRQSTDKLERNFIVSAVIFKKYVPIFKSIFRAPSEEPLRVHRSRKQRWDRNL